MGISLANLADYPASAAYYVRALALNPRAAAGAPGARAGRGACRVVCGDVVVAGRGGDCCEEGRLSGWRHCLPHAHCLPARSPPHPPAPAVWGYLRTSLSCAGRQDLMGAVDGEDLAALQQALPLE